MIQFFYLKGMKHNKNLLFLFMKDNFLACQKAIWDRISVTAQKLTLT